MADAPKFFQWRPHPWHGLAVGPNPPMIVHAYIEITPFDTVKYEVDKLTGYLRVDRPQRTSAQPPMLYGFIPRTYCGSRVGKLSPKANGGDKDPLDICVISERPVAHSEVILNARVVGGIQLIDNGLADDKIIGILANDTVWDKVKDISELPDIFVERMKHYFSTYKIAPGKEAEIWIEELYGTGRALEVVKASMEDYDDLLTTVHEC
jgi:inorganic pyrophosphatase